ncbi:hypothetical protein AADZ86_16150 [Colwelliaceae bacterium BS250]
MRLTKLAFKLIIYCILLNLSGCDSSPEVNITESDIKDLKKEIFNKLQVMPELFIDVENNLYSITAQFAKEDIQHIELNKLEKITIETIRNSLPITPHEISVTINSKLTAFPLPCQGENKTLSIRLTINKEGKVFAFGSEISDAYLTEKLKELPYGCASTRLAILYEKGTSPSHIDRVDSLVSEAGAFTNYAPILFELPELTLL